MKTAERVRQKHVSFVNCFFDSTGVKIQIVRKFFYNKREGRLASLGGDGMHSNKITTTSPIPSM
jgi:hypothetical protein